MIECRRNFLHYQGVKVHKITQHMTPLICKTFNAFFCEQSMNPLFHHSSQNWQLVITSALNETDMFSKDDYIISVTLSQHSLSNIVSFSSLWNDYIQLNCMQCTCGSMWCTRDSSVLCMFVVCENKMSFIILLTLVSCDGLNRLWGQNLLLTSHVPYDHDDVMNKCH